MNKTDALKLSNISLEEGLIRFKHQFACSFEKITFQKWGNQENSAGKTCSLIYVIEGQGVLSHSNGLNEQVGPGDIIQKLPGRACSLHFFDNPSEQIVLTLPDIFYNLYARREIDGSDASLFHIGLHSELFFKFRRLQDEISEWATTRIFRIIEKSLKLITEIQAHRLLLENQAEGDLKWLAVRRSLCRELKNRFSLPDFAEKFSMSYSSFRQGFTRNIGMPPGVFHINQRIEQVKMLLAGSQLSLKEIASSFNYPDLPSFSKQFKKITGESPRDYLKKMDRFLIREMR